MTSVCFAARGRVGGDDAGPWWGSPNVTYPVAAMGYDKVPWNWGIAQATP